MVSARSAVAATMLLATSCACLPVTRIEPGKPAAGSSRTSPLAEIVPPSGVAPLNRSMRIVSPLATRNRGDSGELETRHIIAELAVREADRPLRQGLDDGPAQLKRERDRARHPAAGERQKVVSEASVDAPVDLQIERSLARQRRRSGDADGVRPARIGGRVNRRSLSGEPARSRDVERRQSVAARLRETHMLQPDAPVTGRIAGRPPDRGVEIGRPGRVQTRRHEIKSAASGNALALARRSSVDPARPESDRRPESTRSAKVLDVDSVVAISQRERAPRGRSFGPRAAR